MISTKIIIFLFGLIALSYAQPDCQLRFWKDQSSGFVVYDGTNNVAPFTGSGLNPIDPDEPGTPQNTISSATFAEVLFCDNCILTVYSTYSFGGRSEVYDDIESPYQMTFPFCIKSFIFDCETGGNPGGGEEEEEQEEEQQ